jgi:pimeloyl-ACP methyl ester carboxylesterase
MVIPDRTGYGRSGTLSAQPPDFHRRAAEETFAVLDALGIVRAALWGHSDGAVIALWMALADPDRVAAVVAEATHFYRRKPASRRFFETMRDAPENLGPRVAAALQQEHGERWRRLIQINGEAWLRIADENRPWADLYDGRLAALRVPTLLVHGAKDPRTEPGELDALIASVRGPAPGGTDEPGADAALRLAMFAEGGHSPHSERPTADDVTAAATAFLARTAAAHGFGRAAPHLLPTRADE